MSAKKEEIPTEQHLENASLELMKSYLNACHVMSNYNKVPQANWQDIFNLEHIYKIWFSELTRNPLKLLHAQQGFMRDYVKLCQQVQTLMHGNVGGPVITTEKSDKRFRGSDWQTSPYFFYLQQCYLLFAQHCNQFVADNKSDNPKIARQVTFFTKQFLDAIAPTNFMYSNPDVMKQILQSNGESLFQGFKHFIDDIKEGHGYFNMKMTDSSAFEIGINVAVTPGKVIFQNRMCQLIQYNPTTANVHQRPLLIIPPWINKYYVLDLKEKNSFVKWIVSQGFTVFMISWVNPDSSYKDTTFEDYVFEGILAAIDAIGLATNQEEVNALGFCIGGTLLAIAVAYMKAKHDKRIVSATFLTTLLDFTDPGEIEVFIDEPQLETMEQKMKLNGYLDGRVLMQTFNLLRVNDLFWPYYINNYLSGKNPYPFDLLYWNSDSVNLPQKMLSFFLRNMYLKNLLVHKNAMSIGKVKLDLTAVNIPAYFLSTELDHIAPWESTFMGAKHLRGHTTFVLGGSGHIAGVVNPPSNQKYSYHYSDTDLKEFTNAKGWLAMSKFCEGSWWMHWIEWLKQYGGTAVNPRIPGSSKLPVLQDAPGDYVKKRLP